MSSPTFRPTPAAGSGSGDMTKAVYDTDDSGVVDDSTLWDGEALPAIADATGGQVLALKSDKSGFEFATLNPIGYSDVSTTATLPASPDTGEIYEFIGTGENWTLTANTGQYIRMLSTVSTVGGTIASTSGYDTICLIYIGSNVWLVKSAMGILEVT